MIQFAIAFLVALAASLIATPLVGNLATRFGFVDRPDGKRKAHQQPVALGGGGAVLAAALIAIAAAFGFTMLVGGKLLSSADVPVMGSLLIGSLLIVALGLIDDLTGMRGRYKLLGQFVVASLLIYGGIRIESVSIFAGDAPSETSTADAAGAEAVATDSTAPEPIEEPAVVEIVPASETAPSLAEVAAERTPLIGADGALNLGLLAIPFTLFWLLGCINAINLIDGIDGLASSVGLVLCLTIAAITFFQGNHAETMIMLALGGALLGFLRFNFAPATIYLGDAGSMLIGLLIGTIAIHSSLKSAATVALAVPCGVWAIPILDSGAAILRRKLTGRSLFAPDRGHFHHSLLVRGWTVRQAVLFIGLICTITCLSAVLSIYLGMEWLALATVGGMVLFLIVTQTFGHIEFALLKDRFRSSVLPFAGANGHSVSGAHESRIQLQGARQWDKLWAAIVESADDYRLQRLKLIIHIPALHEDFFASWDATRDRKGQTETCWHIVHPIVVGGDVVGQLEIEGDPAGDSTLAHMIQVLDFLEPIEGDVQHIMEEIQHDQATVRVGSVAASRRTVQTTTATSEPTADPVSTAPIDPAVGSTAVTPAAAQQVTANE